MGGKDFFMIHQDYFGSAFLGGLGGTVAYDFDSVYSQRWTLSVGFNALSLHWTTYACTRQSCILYIEH